MPVLNGLHHPGRVSPCNAERGDASCDNRPSANDRALAYRDPGKDGRSNADPAVFLDRNRVSVDVPTGRDVFIVKLGDDGDIWADKNSIANGDLTAVHDSQAA